MSVFECEFCGKETSELISCIKCNSMFCYECSDYYIFYCPYCMYNRPIKRVELHTGCATDL